MDEWIDQWSADEPSAVLRGKPTARKTPARKRTSQKAPSRKAPSKMAAGKKAAEKTTRTAPARTPASREAIGSNPTRRYGSAGSRSLSR